jgi:hypothetical protein
VPTHRYLLSYLIDSFLMILHRPYIFTRPNSQRQVYTSALAILDSQDRLFEVTRTLPTQFHIILTFPTFDAAVLLAVVLVSSPERYHASFSRSHQSLNRAFERLKLIGSVLPLARIGSEILETTLRRVVEAHERSRALPIDSAINLTSNSPQIPPAHGDMRSTLNGESWRVSQSPGSEKWLFEVNTSEMDCAAQNPEFFGSSDPLNLEAPMPLKELLLDEEIAIAQLGLDAYDPSFWTSAQNYQDQMFPVVDQQMVMDGGDNSLWNFLAGYPVPGDNSTI